MAESAITPSEPPKSRPKPDPEARMTFTAHLGELRMRLIRSCIAACVGLVVCYAMSNSIIEVLSQPLRSLQVKEATKSAEAAPDSDTAAATAEDQGRLRAGGVTWTVLSPMEPFLVKLKISAYGGVFFALPYIIYQACAFIFPGLTGAERRVVKVMLFGCAALAVCGTAMAYWLIFPYVLPMLVNFVPEFVDVQLRLNETLSIILKGISAFAVAFQLPMVILVLVYLGIVSPATLKAYRKVSIVGIFVVAAVLTPPDPISLMLMALPLLGLYELSVWASHVVVRRKAKAAAAAEA